MIELKNIKKSFPLGKGKAIVLNDISLSVNRGEMVAVMGASGSGKSTLLNILGCLEDADEGNYFCDGAEVTKMSPSGRERFRKDTISFVFQQFALIGSETVYGNIEVPLKARNMARSKRRSLIMSVARKMGIEDQLFKKPALISGGQQQRCAIARALVTDNPIILADEPTGALDKKTGKEIMAILKDLSREGKTVIVVTHDESVAEIADRIIRIEDGKLVTGEET